MERIIDSRGTGKTRKLMEYAVANDAVFVCGNPPAMERKAHDYGIFGLRTMDYQDFAIELANQPKYVIDEMEEYLKFYDSGLIGYTLTNED